ncbi:unnamed protein product [Echinostoma caproni]|uniref:IQ calmodulin-binding motif-containing protein 1-like n=1 Tax=Echinostoma caproni TaxID=27848 RepID=A0A183ARS4_9TREM|nr:unnamed protein product [Echinostoma caproni]
MSKTLHDDIATIEDQLYNLRFTDELSVVSTLVKLQNNLSRVVDASAKSELQCRLLRSNVPQLICATLKQDFSTVPDGWNQALVMCGLLASILQVSVEHERVKNACTPDDLFTESVSCMLILLRRLQKQLLKMKRITSEESNASTDQMYHLIEQIINYLYEIMHLTPQVAFCLLVILGCETQLRSLILKRYRGIQLLVARWIAQTCDSNYSSADVVDSPTKKMLLSLKKFLGEFHSTTAPEQSVRRGLIQLNTEQAATVIQSHWRGFAVRRTLRNMNRALSSFQNRQQTVAAVRIQAAYRGYQARSRLADQRALATRHRAARVIQNWYRGHVSRRECLRNVTHVAATPVDMGSKQDDAKELHQTTIERHRGWCETHPSVPMSREKLEELHKTTQLRLRAFQFNRLKAQQQSETRRANLARIALDADLLFGEPSGSDPGTPDEMTRLARAVERRCSSAGGLDVDPFRCRIQPIAKLAQEEHRQSVARLGKPWWTVLMREWNKKSTQWLLANEARADREDPTASDASCNWHPDDLFDTSQDTCVVSEYERAFCAFGEDNEQTDNQSPRVCIA